MRWRTITKRLRTEYGLVSTYPCLKCRSDTARIWNHMDGSSKNEFGECKSPCGDITHYEPICRACFALTYSDLPRSSLAGRHVR